MESGNLLILQFDQGKKLLYCQPIMHLFNLQIFQNSVVNVGTFISMPIFHYFNLNDNIIILLSFSSAILIRIVKAFARSEGAFFASTAFGVFMGVSSAPIRAQITRCVSVEELGKVTCSFVW